MFDDILEKGDQMYMHIGKGSYLTVKIYHPVLQKYLKHYIELCMAIQTSHIILLIISCGFIFTMGSGLPCYSSAVVKNGRSYFYFDPHSRNESGNLSADGLASLTCHKTINDLSLFIKHLAASLNEKGTVPFEISVIEKAETENTFESDESDEPDFYGFRDMSEGEITCQLFLASEKASTTLDNASSSDISEASDVKCQRGSDADINNSDNDLNPIPNEHDEDIDNVLSAMNDSATFVNSKITWLCSSVRQQWRYIQ